MQVREAYKVASEVFDDLLIRLYFTFHVYKIAI
jgi:hypothetical protein